MSHLQDPLSICSIFQRVAALIGLILLFALPVNLRAQDDLNIHGVVSDAMTSSKLGEVTVQVNKDGTSHDSYTTRANGKYEFYLDCGSHYELVFKKDGYVDRSIVIDSRNVPPEVVGAGIIMPTDMSMYEITEAMEGADLSVFQQPIGKASYNAAEADLIWDFSYTNKVKGEIFAFIRDVEKRQKELDKEASEADKAAAELEEKFKSFVADGDAAMSKQNYEDAVLNYKAALDLKPEDQTVPPKLGDAQTKWDSEKAAAELDNSYSAALDAGDGFMRTEEFDKAISSYEEALKLKPNESYPKDQIAKANSIVAERAANMAKQEQFNKLISEGEASFAEKKYEKALGSFQAALEVFPDNKEAQRKLDETNAAIQELAARAAKQESYDNLIAQADQARDAKSYEAAIGFYEEASKVFPEEEYPKAQITICQQNLEALASAAEKQAKFDELMADGSKSVTEAKYDEAISSFEEALTLFPDDSNAKSKLNEARSLKAELEAEAQKQEQYEGLISEADDLFKNEDYELAREKYQAAKDLIPAEIYPTEKITEINAILTELAASAAAEEAYSKAMAEGEESMEKSAYDSAIASFQKALEVKPGDKDASEKLESATELRDQLLASQAKDEQYQTLIDEGDALMASESFEESKSKYEAALAVKPDEKYPQDQIALILQTLEQRAAEAEEQARLAEQDALYQKFLKAGNEAMTAENYLEAISKYEEALGVKPEDELAAKRLEEATALQAAKDEMASLNDKYNSRIEEADKKYADQAYNEAISLYTQASELKPEEKYPQDQIKLIEETLAAAAEAEKMAAEKALSNQIAALVLEGDQMVQAKDFQSGISKYEEALALDATRDDIQAKIDAANNALLSFMEAEALDETYNQFISDADKAFEKQELQEAKGLYESALDVKPNEPYPAQQIAEIETKLEILAETNAKEEALRLQAEFDELIANGDKFFGKGKYDKALIEYEAAKEVLPENELAQQKIDEVNALLMQMSEADANRQAYDAAIEEADDLFKEESYEIAKLKYLDAQQIMPEETYPGEKITEIDILLEKRRLEEEALAEKSIEEQYQSKIREADSHMSIMDYDKAIDSYTTALEIKPEEVYPSSQIERIQLLKKEMEEAEKERERLAALEKERASKRPNLEKSTVNTSSEQQAEQFMKDALAAQERERYERIKKLKRENAEALLSYSEISGETRSSNYNDLKILQDNYSVIFGDAISYHQSIAEATQNFKGNVYDDQKLQAEMSLGRMKASQKRIEDSQLSREEWIDERIAIEAEKIRRERELAQEREGKISIYTSNQEAEKLRTERSDAVMRQSEEYAQYNADLTKKNLEDIKSFSDKIRERSTADDQSWKSRSDERIAENAKQIDKERKDQEAAFEDRKAFADEKRLREAAALGQLKTYEPKDYNEYFRTDLAKNYPQGVTEESSSLGNKVIITRIVVIGNKGDEYKKVLDIAGNYYFKNGQSISENTWHRETIQAFDRPRSD
jgi:tetratricopeptide (TPR) repeat protein